MKYTKKIVSFSLMSLVLTAVLAQPTEAFTFTKDFLISDGELGDSNALSSNGIESFLEEKGSVLAGLQIQSVNGSTQLVSRVIKDAAERYDLNPMLFLVMAQKESSAITSSTMTSAIQDRLLGYAVPDSGGADLNYAGIMQQIEGAGNQIRNGYLDDLESRGYTISGWGPGITKTTLDGIQVTPQNDATAALYTYNPWVGRYGGGAQQWGANSAFQKIWQEWNTIPQYPNGTLLQINQVVYLLQDGKKRPFTSRGALLSSHSPTQIIPVSTIVGDQYEDGAPINYPNYSLLRNPAGTVFLLANGKKRGFKSQEALRQVGINPEEIIDVEWRDIKGIPDGKNITAKTTYPAGAFLQNVNNGAVFYVTPKGKRRPVIDSSILENRQNGRTIIQAERTELKQFVKVNPLKLQNGTLVTSPKTGTIFIIDQGKRRPFPSREIFDLYGYQMKDVQTVPHNVLKLHKKGRKMPRP